MRSNFKKILVVCLFFTLLFLFVKTSKSQTCDPECCRKPDGYVYNNYLNEFCDAQYKGGRWATIEGVCRGEKKGERRGCTTCDPCLPNQPRTNPPNLQINECTPSGCGDGQISDQIKVRPNSLFVKNSRQNPIKLTAIIIARKKRIELPFDLNPNDSYQFNYSSYCDLFKNILKSTIDIYLSFNQPGMAGLDNLVKNQVQCGGNGIINFR
jgi:hypothetical protein